MPRGSTPTSSEQLLSLIFDSARDYAIFTTDRTGVVTSWNNGAARLLGWKHGEIVGQTADLIFTDNDRSAGVPQKERDEASLNGRAEDERWQQCENGTQFWASGLSMRLEDPNEGFVKILRDRTETHLAAEKIQQSEERFRLLASNIPQLVFRGLSDGSRTWPSPQWINFTGLNAEESLGTGWLNAVHPDDRAGTIAA